jgi:nitrogen fixation NifU-like protein
MAYSKQVVDRFESVLANPAKHSVGRFDPKDPNVISGMVGAPACGDVMKLDMKMNGDVIEDVKFKTYGCGSAIDEAKLITDKEIAGILDLPPIKLHCSVLAEGAIRQALSKYDPMIGHNNPPSE